MRGATLRETVTLKLGNAERKVEGNAEGNAVGMMSATLETTLEDGDLEAVQYWKQCWR